MDTLQYYLDNVIDFFSFSRPHSAMTWIPLSVLLVFALLFMLIGYSSFTVGIIGSILLVWFIRYDDFSLVERIVAIVLTILLFAVPTYFLYTGEISAREVDEVYTVIEHLPREVTVKTADAITQAREIYDALDDRQKEGFMPEYYEYLTSREEALEEAYHQAELDTQREALMEEYDAAVEEAKAKSVNSSSTSANKTDEDAQAEASTKQEIELRSQVSALNRWWHDTYMDETLFSNALACVKEFQVKEGKVVVLVDEKKREESGDSLSDFAKYVSVSLYLYPGQITAKNWNDETDLALSQDDIVTS